MFEGFLGVRHFQSRIILIVMLFMKEDEFF